jgi:TM2 domain-containing membrane protein YozV
VNVNVTGGAMPQKQKNPLLAAIGSFFIPGLGQVYNGEGMLKGMLYVLGMIIGSIVLVLPGLAVWIYGIYNAYKVAGKINLGEVPYKETSIGKIILYIILVFVVEFVLIFIIAIVLTMLMALIFGSTSYMYGY